MTAEVSQEFDVVVIGAGQAGIAVSHYLQAAQVRHVVLERDMALSSWRNRWDGFRTNTPNWMNTLPFLTGDRFPSDDPDAFATRDEILEYLEACLDAVDPPISVDTEVTSVARVDGDIWEVRTNRGVYRSRCVVVCNGAMSSPRVPGASSLIPDAVPQIHSSEYRNPEQIGTRSVLVVGSASSGIQITKLLCESSKFDRVHLAVSKVTVLPKRILGVQIHRLLHRMGLFDVRTRSILGRLMYSGLESRGDPITRPHPGDLASVYGVKLYSKFTGVDGLALRFADGQTLGCEDLTIIWCTGFKGDYDWIRVDGSDLLDEHGTPHHTRGVSDRVPGLYFVGLRYQHTVASHDIYGVAADARFVVDRVLDRLTGPGSRIEAGADDQRGTGT